MGNVITFFTLFGGILTLLCPVNSKAMIPNTSTVAIAILPFSAVDVWILLLQLQVSNSFVGQHEHQVVYFYSPRDSSLSFTPTEVNALHVQLTTIVNCDRAKTVQATTVTL